MVEWLTLLFGIMDIPGSYPARRLDILRLFSSVSKKNARIVGVSQNRPGPLPPQSFQLLATHALITNYKHIT